MRVHYFKHRQPLIFLEPDKILVSPSQPRQIFDGAALSSLTESIKENGILQPLTVRKTLQGYVLIAGERRLRAAKAAGLHKVPCTVAQVNEAGGALLSLLENLQREDLTCFEEAAGIEALIRVWGFSQEDAAARLGMAASTLSNKLRLLQLTEWQRERIAAAGLSERHARALLQIKDDGLRSDLLLKIIAQNLTVAQTEQLIRERSEQQQSEQMRPKRKAVIGDIRLFANTIHHAVATMQRSGVAAKAEKTENDLFIEYKITIPKLNDEKPTEGEQLKLFV